MRYRTLLLVLLACLFASAGSANTLLTNGIPVTFTLPIGTVAGSFYGGDFGFAIYVPPGAVSLTIAIDTDILYSLDILVRFNADVGASGLGNLKFDYSARGGTGPKQLVIKQHSIRPLQSGAYYFDFS
ncbi:MAG: hypothetical protein HY238_14045, partial [Acidobacteria bacterium]|nr:hypothetical protein [Acidobacteriota bacterium]